MEIMVLLFETGLEAEKLMKTSNERYKKFKDVKGLVQKYYMSDAESSKVGGVYVFDTKENLDAFFESDLSKSTSEAYKFQGQALRSFFNVSRTLRE
ncbi:MAG: YdhR family protein [Promethearchaeota archaeon]